MAGSRFKSTSEVVDIGIQYVFDITQYISYEFCYGFRRMEACSA